MSAKRIRNIRRIFIILAVAFAGAAYGGISAYSMLPGDSSYILDKAVRTGIICLIIAISASVISLFLGQCGTLMSEATNRDSDDDLLKEDNRRWFRD